MNERKRANLKMDMSIQIRKKLANHWIKLLAARQC